MPSRTRRIRRHRRGEASFWVSAPSDLPQLLYWYKADALSLVDNDPVQTWTDSSGNGRDLTQGTLGLRPLYKTNILNSKPVVRFDGIDDTMTTSTFSSEAQPNTLFLVVSRVAFAAAATAATGKDANSHHSIQIAGSGSTKLTYAAPNARNSTSVFVTTVPKVVSAVFDDAASKLYADGVDVTPGTVGPGTNPFIGVTLGSAFSGAANFLDGDIAEYLFYGYKLSTGDRRHVESYLGTKYGITVT